MKANTDIKHFRIYRVSPFKVNALWTAIILLPTVPDNGRGIRILCGCRNFTLAEARAHWKKRDYNRSVLKEWIAEKVRDLKGDGYRLHDRK